MLTRRCLLILGMLSLLILLVPACGNDDGNTSTDTAPPTVTQAPTLNSDPVKIGVITAWSGSAGVAGLLADQSAAVMEKQIEERGGILGGRPVEFVKFDNQGEAAKTASGTLKLIQEDKVSVLALGGINDAQLATTANVAKEHKVMFFSAFDSVNIDRAGNKYYAPATPSSEYALEYYVDMVVRANPETVAYLADDATMYHTIHEGIAKSLEEIGGKIVYTAFVPYGTSDMTPYLTRIKHEDPDVLFISLDGAATAMAAKQMMDLGGWGNIQVTNITAGLMYAKMPGTWGWVVTSAWDSSSDYPTSVKFVEDFQAINGSMPNSTHLYFYMPLLAAVEAIELAGTDDPEDIAQAARSGDLKFDSPMGMAHYTPDGDPQLHYILVQIKEGGEIVPFEW